MKLHKIKNLKEIKPIYYGVHILLYPKGKFKGRRQECNWLSYNKVKHLYHVLKQKSGVYGNPGTLMFFEIFD